MPANLAKVILKVINVYYQEPSADTSDIGYQNENYKKLYFLLDTNLSAQMMITNDDHNIMQW